MPQHNSGRLYEETNPEMVKAILSTSSNATNRKLLPRFSVGTPVFLNLPLPKLALLLIIRRLFDVFSIALLLLCQVATVQLLPSGVKISLT
ncbi:MAG: hypothetical protein ACI901_000069 [Octadecabacter sp.]|jgi:hypothetical protein